ncbi:sodium:solute symporter family protein [candidate division WOR-3 bacterium]|nr:sodium:solute symporter family protein [candidate division WOR-3 bacterium]
MNYSAIALYFFVIFLISVFAKKKTASSPLEYFIAGRSFGGLVLFFTLAATNFSAFFFLGFAGAAWKYGFGQYGIMAIGTSLVPFSFYFIGKKAWKLGKEKNYMTLPELVGGEFNSPLLRKLLLSVMVISTLPYIYTQALGGGIILSSVLGFDLVREGACLSVFLIGATVVLGGMRGTAWTDVFQGIFMTVAMAAAAFFVMKSLGGSSTAGQSAFSISPLHFSRPGPENFFTEVKWITLIMLWTFVNPLFPHIFSRFFAAKNTRALKTSVWLYPFLVGFLFLPPVLIGVWARGTLISFTSPDTVLPTMVETYAPKFIYILTMTGALAALMSTADSQLLSVSTMLAKDLFRTKNQIAVGKIFTFFICLAVCLMSLVGVSSQTAIFNFLVGTTFSALAAAFPSVFCALYFKRIGKIPVITSLVAGEITVIGIFFKLLPTFGIAEGIAAMVVSFFFLTFSYTLIKVIGKFFL